MLSRAAHTDQNSPSPDNHASASGFNKRFWALAIGCVGVAYGDIGTSPLYAFREAIVHTARDGAITQPEVMGILSLILWSLTVIVTIKYILFLLRADNRGEGGTLALMALAQRAVGRGPGLILTLGMLGAALFYADAAITPAISVLSAVEGLKLVTAKFDDYILLITMALLFILFSVQKSGTQKISVFFGPITSVWFLSMAAAGIYWIVQNPIILQAINPAYAIEFLFSHGKMSFIVLGSAFLAITGAESLYADLGHFGRRPIQYAWLWLVFPCLTLNYFGQGALVLARPEALENPFFLLVPEWALLPLVILATMATIIASQAVITGAYSITQQAIQLGLLPRMEIKHTSADQQGQIYMPKLNNMLFYAVLFLCLIFGSSSALASAYGVAVTGTMIVTSMMAFVVVWKIWGKGPWLAAALILPFLLMEIVFLSANMLKVFDGGYVPLAIAVFLVLCMSIWVRGTIYLQRRAERQSIPLSDLIEELDRNPPANVPGTAVFLTSDPFNAPIALMLNLQHNKVLHEKNIVLTVISAQSPKVDDRHRIVVEHISSRVTRVIASYGFMETPDVPSALALAVREGVEFNIEESSFFLGRRNIVPDARRGLPVWQEKIYINMAKSAANATDFYRIPSGRVVELGIQLAI